VERLIGNIVYLTVGRVSSLPILARRFPETESCAVEPHQG